MLQDVKVLALGMQGRSLATLRSTPAGLAQAREDRVLVFSFVSSFVSCLASQKYDQEEKDSFEACLRREQTTKIVPRVSLDPLELRLSEEVSLIRFTTKLMKIPCCAATFATEACK